MELELNQLAAGLGLPPATVERWIRQGRLPARQKGETCSFSFSSMRKWAETHHLHFAPPKEGRIQATPPPVDTLLGAMRRGGIFYDTEGEDIGSALQAAVRRIPHLDGPELQNKLLTSLLAREQLMSTGVGRGIAIPHPRTPLVETGLSSLISVSFLKTPIDYHALDRVPVFVLFIMVCPSPKTHLHLLARLSFCLREPGFAAFLGRRPQPDVLYETIEAMENRMNDEPGKSS